MQTSQNKIAVPISCAAAHALSPVALFKAERRDCGTLWDVVSIKEKTQRVPFQALGLAVRLDNFV